MGELYVRRTPGSAISVRRALAFELVAAGASDDAVFDVSLIGTELVSNAVLNAQPLATGHYIARWNRTDGLIRVELQDGGSAADTAGPTERASGPTEHNTNPLAIVAAVAAAWGTEKRGSGRSIWAELKFDSR